MSRNASRKALQAPPSAAADVGSASTAVVAVGPSLAELVTEWLDTLDVREGSARNYRLHITAYVGWLSRELRAGNNVEDLRSWRDALLDRATSGTLGAGTAREYITTARRFYGFLFRRGVAPMDFGAMVRPIRTPRNRHSKDFLSLTQARGLVARVSTSAAAPSDVQHLVRLRALAYLLLKLGTGIRDIEAVRANVGNLRALAEGGLGELEVHGKGRDTADESVIVPAEALSALREYLTARGDHGRPSAPLFVSHSPRSRGARITSRGLREIARGLLAAAGLHSARVTGHSLRHTAATLALSNGASLERVQEMLRHADPATTAIYAKRLDRVSGAAELSIPSMLSA